MLGLVLTPIRLRASDGAPRQKVFETLRHSLAAEAGFGFAGGIDSQLASAYHCHSS